MNIQDFEILTKTRSSHRKFLEDEIPKKDIEKLIELAGTAPSGHNHQPWQFIVVTDEKMKQEIEEVLNNKLEKIKNSLPENFAEKFEKFTFFITHFLTAPVIIFVLGNKQEYISTKVRAAAGKVMPKAANFDMELLDIGAAVQNILLGATAMGYGSCWLTAPINYAQKDLESVLGVEQGYNLLSVVSVGKPTKQRKQAVRKSLDQTLTFK